MGNYFTNYLTLKSSESNSKSLYVYCDVINFNKEQKTLSLIKHDGVEHLFLNVSLLDIKNGTIHLVGYQPAISGSGDGPVEWSICIL